MLQSTYLISHDGSAKPATIRFMLAWRLWLRNAYRQNSWLEQCQLPYTPFNAIQSRADTRNRSSPLNQCRCALLFICRNRIILWYLTACCTICCQTCRPALCAPLQRNSSKIRGRMNRDVKNVCVDSKKPTMQTNIKKIRNNVNLLPLRRGSLLRILQCMCVREWMCLCDCQSFNGSQRR